MRDITRSLKSKLGRRNRRQEMQAWGDARSMPFTEGQAVLAPGHIGPGVPVPRSA